MSFSRLFPRPSRLDSLVGRLDVGCLTWIVPRSRSFADMVCEATRPSTLPGAYSQGAGVRKEVLEFGARGKGTEVGSGLRHCRPNFGSSRSSFMSRTLSMTA